MGFEMFRPGSWLGVIGLAAFLSPSSFGQVVTLPSVGNFSVQTSVSAPDSGAASLGSMRRGAYGSTSRGGLIGKNRALGGSTQAAGASVHVQVIDLEALDQSILQAAESSRSDRNSTLGTSGQKFDSSMARSFDTEQFSSSRTASYDYMAVLNHPHDPTIIRDYAGDVRFFLEQARKARDGGRWSGAQVYYDQAWSRLSQAQKSQVLQELAKAQEQRAKRAKEGTPSPKS